MSVTMNQRVFKVTLHQGEDLDRLAELSKAASRLSHGENATGVEHGEYAAAAEEHDAFLAEATKRAVVLGMKPLPRKAYQALQILHPPRDDNDGDATLGVNAATFAEPLLIGTLLDPFDQAEREAFLAALIAGNDLPPCPDRMAFLDSLSNAQFTFLVDEALTMNRVVYAPKAPLLGSAPAPSSDETSGSPGSTSD